MNEYTRREEIRWTLATVFILVPCVAIAMVRLMLAQGPMVTNPASIKAEADAKQAQQGYQPCVQSAKTLVNEVDVYRIQVKNLEDRARDEAQKERDKDPKRKDEPITPVMPWAQAWGKSPDRILKLSKALQQDGCRTATEKVVAPSVDTTKVWDVIAKAAAIKDPPASPAPPPGKQPEANAEQEAAAKQLYTLFKDVSLEKFWHETGKAGDKPTGQVVTAADVLDAALKDATTKRGTDLVRAPLPQGLFPPGAAIGVGVGVSLAALIISYFSVRSASLRRGRTLVALRRFANTPEAGLQAAAIVRLAAHHNGGEPGMVIGAAFGGLTAAVLSPTDNPNIFIADLFVAGSMGGLLIGLAAQWLLRTLTGVSRWRERTKELGDIEKPTIPVALVLGGVTPGLEKQFLRYFEALPVADAATVVQKLAAQAEEQILAAADAAAQQQMYGAQAAGGSWGPGQM